MPELEPVAIAHMQLNDVRRQLLDAAAFGKRLPPEWLEHMAGRVADGLRIYTAALDSVTAVEVSGRADLNAPAGPPRG